MRGEERETTPFLSDLPGARTESEGECAEPYSVDGLDMNRLFDMSIISSGLLCGNGHFVV